MKRHSTRDTIVLCLIVFGSLAISGGLGAWLVRGLILERGPQFQQPGSTRGYYASAIWQGDLWYCTSAPTMPGKVPECHIRRRNLETGEDRETKLAVTEQPWLLLATADRLWIIGAGSNVYESNGESILRTSPALTYPESGPTGVIPLIGNYFIQDGVLSSVREYQPERYRIVHLVEDQWLDAAEVILPGSNRQWENDESQQRKVPTPRTCSSPLTPGSSSIPTLTVVPDGQRLHLMFADVFRDFLAYREGFEFLETPDNAASALLPQNAPPEASGWEYVTKNSFMPVQTTGVMSGVPLIAVNWQVQRNGVIEGAVLSRVWRRAARDRFELYDDIPTKLVSYPVFVSSPSRDVCYLLAQRAMGGAEVFAVEPTGLRKLPHDLPGYEWAMIGWHVRLGLAIGAAWLTHVVLLVIGIGWFQSRQDRVIVSGHGSASLGSVSRRAVARSMDLVFVLLPVLLHIASLSSTADLVAVSSELSQQESHVTSIRHNNWQGNYRMLIRDNWPKLVSAYAMLQWSLLGSLAVWFVFVAVEGAYGMTPGKWLSGLRTMRTTLRPCGFARAILRDVLLCVDVVLLLTPIPAVVGCVLSPHRQRWGDRVADTVVVEAGSLRQTTSDRNDP